MTDHEQEWWVKDFHLKFQCREEDGSFTGYLKQSEAAEVVAFISEQVRKADQEGFKRGQGMPFDVSNWERVGRERGYWDYFERKARVEGGEAVLKEVNDAGCECDGEDCGYCKIRHFLVSVAKETVDRLREGLNGK